MEDVEFLKAMLAEINANMKSNQEKAEASMVKFEEEMDTSRKADREEIKK
jgi:hypothetical protein